MTHRHPWDPDDGVVSGMLIAVAAFLCGLIVGIHMKDILNWVSWP